MMIHENELAKYGFTDGELEKLRNTAVRTETPLDTILNDLANRFKALYWVLSVMALIFVITLFVGSHTHAVTFGVAVLFLGGLFTVTIPLKLAFKSWQYRRVMLNSRHRQ